MTTFPAKKSPLCTSCSFYQSRSETQHLGLAHCQHLQITVVSMSSACSCFVPRKAVLAGLDLFCSLNGHENLCIYVLADKRDNILAHVLGTALAPCCKEMDVISSLGCSLLPVARGREVVEYASLFLHRLVLSEEFWTCDCEDDCVRHEHERPCPICGSRKHTGRCKTLKEILRNEQARRQNEGDCSQ